MHATCIDARELDGAWAGATADAVRIQTDAQTTSIPFDDLLSIDFDNSPTPPPTTRPAGTVRVEFLNGTRIAGLLQPAPTGRLAVQHPIVGRLEAPFEQLRSVVFTQHEADPGVRRALDPWRTQRPTERDVVVVKRDGQVHSVRAVLLALGPDGGQLTLGERTVSMTPALPCGVIFSAAGAAPPTRHPAARVTLTDQTRLAATIESADQKTLRVRAAGAADPIHLPLRAIRQIDFHSPRVTFAGELEPLAVNVEPYLHTTWPLRRNRSVTNRPIRLAGHEYDKGLGVHARTEARFATSGRFRQFAATIGIDDAARPRGHVIFRVLADGKEVFNSGPTTGRDAPKPILVDIAGAQHVSLIVEFGQQADIGDQADWAAARFLK